MGRGIAFWMMWSLVTSLSTPARAPAATGCWPAWAQQDLARAAETRLPVPTVAVSGRDGNLGSPLTARNLAAWLGSRRGASSTVDAILAGLRGTPTVLADDKRRLAVEPGRTTWALLLSMRQVTPYQARVWAPRYPGGPAALRLTFLPPAGTRDTVRAALAALLHDPASATVGLFTARRLKPGPAAFWSFRGPIRPGALLAAGSRPGFVCHASSDGAIGLASGWLLPRRFYAASLYNGVGFGFAPGQVVVANTHPGADITLWYAVPGIRVPAGYRP